MTVNRPEIIAELTARHEQYEKALADNDVALLDSMFWQERPAISQEPGSRRAEITTFGDSAGVIHIRRADPEPAPRETQFWIRFEAGWKIVSAHVSRLPGPPSYLDAASAHIGLPIEPAMRAGVEADLHRIGAIAAFLMEFPLGQDVEPAPVFHPEQ